MVHFNEYVLYDRMTNTFYYLLYKCKFFINFYKVCLICYAHHWDLFFYEDLLNVVWLVVRFSDTSITTSFSLSCGHTVYKHDSTTKIFLFIFHPFYYFHAKLVIQFQTLLIKYMKCTL